MKSVVSAECKILKKCTVVPHFFDRKIDKILTSKTFGIPIMLLFLGIIFWITIIGANYPSQLLSTFFNFLENSYSKQYLSCPYRLFVGLCNNPIKSKPTS